MANIHTKFDIPLNRVGCLRTLDEIKEIFTEAASIIKIDGVFVSVDFEETAGVVLTASDDLCSIKVSQNHFFPTALVLRDPGNKSHIKSPDAYRIRSIVMKYFN